MVTPQSRADVLAVEAERFKVYLASLPPEAWDQPSACEGWTVAHVVAHVTSQDFTLRLTRGLSGDFSPPEGTPTVAEHDEDRFAENIYQRALSSRERLGSQLVGDLTRRLDAAARLFRRRFAHHSTVRTSQDNPNRGGKQLFKPHDGRVSAGRAVD